MLTAHALIFNEIIPYDFKNPCRVYIFKQYAFCKLPELPSENVIPKRHPKQIPSVQTAAHSKNAFWVWRGLTLSNSTSGGIGKMMILANASRNNGGMP